MLVEAVIEKGQVRLLQPIRFVHDSFSVKVDIPEEEIVPHNLASAQQLDLDENGVSASSSLIKKIWAARAHTTNEELDLLDGIEKKYE